MNLALKNIVILISGRGSNLNAILEAQKSRNWDAKVVKVICNRPQATGLAVAQDYAIPIKVLDHQSFLDRNSFDLELLKEVKECQPDLVVLAGFMRILSEEFVHFFAGKLINIHPSLLPSFPGMGTHQSALNAGVKWHGSTVHFVTPEVDVGPIIAQGIVPVLQKDTVSTLNERVLAIEHIIYPIAIEWFIKDQLIVKNGNVNVVPNQSQSFYLPNFLTLINI